MFRHPQARERAYAFVQVAIRDFQVSEALDILEEVKQEVVLLLDAIGLLLVQGLDDLSSLGINLGKTLLESYLMGV